MNFTCLFREEAFTLYPSYLCTVTGTTVSDPDSKLGTFNGKHLPRRSDKDVESFIISDAVLEHFPRNLGIKFSFLKEVQIINCSLKQISREDLQGLEVLSALDLQYNQIKLLPDDLFTNNLQLDSINFVGNEIEFASSKLLEPIKNNLRHFTWTGHKGNVNQYRNSLFLNEASSSFSRRRCCPTYSTYYEYDSVDVLMTVINEDFRPPSELMKEPCVGEIKQSVELVGTRNPSSCLPAGKEFGQIIIDGFNELRRSTRFTDFAVISGSKEFLVHKAVLAIQSSVLASMFERETKDRHAIRLEISDISQEAVEVFIDYLYERKQPSFENSIEVFKLSAKYEVVDLKSICEAIMRDNLNESNAFEIFKVASGQYKSDELKLAAFRKIQETFGSKLKDDLMDKPEKLEEILEAKRRLNALMDDNE